METFEVSEQKPQPISAHTDSDGTEKFGTIEVESETINLSDCWHITFNCTNDVFKKNTDPRSYIQELSRLGSIEKIRTESSSIPPFETIDNASSYLKFEIDFKGAVTKEIINDVFAPIKNNCVIRILPPKVTIDEFVQMIREMPKTDAPVGKILEEAGSLTDSELKAVLLLQEQYRDDPEKEQVPQLGEILVKEKMVHQPVIDAALERQKKNNYSE